MIMDPQDDLSDTTLIICMRVSQMTRPVEGAVQRQCFSCQGGVWVSPSTIRDIPGMPGKVKLQCGDCAIPVMIREKATLIPPTAGQREELTREVARRAQ